jgi:hypothetical protein
MQIIIQQAWVAFIIYQDIVIIRAYIWQLLAKQNKIGVSKGDKL